MRPPRNPTDYLLRATCSLGQSLTLATMPGRELAELGKAVMAVPSPSFPH